MLHPRAAGTTNGAAVLAYNTAYITTYLQLTNRWDEFRRLGCHIIPAGGKDHIIQPLAIANAMGIPTIVVFDSDADKYGPIALATNQDPRLAARQPMHSRDNTAILRLSGVATVDPFPTRTLFHPKVVMWHSEIGNVVEDDIGAADWSAYKTAAEQELGQPGGLDKNVIQIAIRLTKAFEAGKRSTHLEQLCQHILAAPARPAGVGIPVAAPPVPKILAPRPRVN